MIPTTIIEKSIAHRAWQLAFNKAFTKNDSCPEWFKINLNEITILVINKFLAQWKQ